MFRKLLIPTSLTCKLMSFVSNDMRINLRTGLCLDLDDSLNNYFLCSLTFRSVQKEDHIWRQRLWSWKVNGYQSQTRNKAIPGEMARSCQKNMGATAKHFCTGIDWTISCAEETKTCKPIHVSCHLSELITLSLILFVQMSNMISNLNSYPNSDKIPLLWP